MTAAALHVRRHRARYVVAGDTSTGAVRAQLDSALAGSLAEHLGPAVEEAQRSVGTDGTDLWLVRRLDVRASVNAQWPAHRIARVIATAIARALTDALRAGPDGVRVLWFPDRAAFLAQYLVDATDGRAAGRWEYADFDGCRDAIEREPAPAMEALRRLGSADLGRLLRALTPNDGARVLAALGTALPRRSTGSVGAAALVVAALGRLLAAAALPDDRHRAALALFVEAARDVDAASTAFMAPVRDLAGLASPLRRADSATLARTCGALERGDWADAPPDVMGALAPLVAWPPDQRRDAARVLRGASTAPDVPSGPPPARLDTPLGGMFLLLPLLTEFAWKGATATWPPLDGVAPDRLLRHLAIVGALGGPRNAAAAADPVLRLALGVPPVLTAADISAWAVGLSVDAVAAASRTLLADLRSRGKLSGRFTVAAVASGVLAVDSARGIWLGTASAEPTAIKELVATIEAALGSRTQTPGEPIDPRHLLRLAEQLSYADVGAPFALPDTVRGLVRRAGQALVRELAWRLPGFGWSTLPYLWENVLAFDAGVEIGDDGFLVQLGDPPLQLVLSLAGMNRREFRLEATEDRTWTLARRP